MDLGFTAALSRARKAVQWVWWWWRQVSGDAAYENYRNAMARRGNVARRHGGLGTGILTREEFYLELLERKSRGARCC